MHTKKRILLKLTGEAFIDQTTRQLEPSVITSLIDQMKELEDRCQFGIVIGGGNFFRGRNEGVTLGMTPSSGHQAGILATMLNGVILKDLLEQASIKTNIFCAVECPPAGEPITQPNLVASLKKGSTLVFTGGTGNPFFTTDTNAVLRALQIEADEIWKGTNVDGVYTKDPNSHDDAQLLTHVTYQEAIVQHLHVMDPTAFALAEQYKQIIRVFNIFQPQALIKAYQQPEMGTRITCTTPLTTSS